ncbi:MAG: flagellar hook-associated protein FlgL [Methylococcaceae bacterium]
MRISTNSFFENSSNRLTELQSQISATAEQISSGRRSLNPSDDPVAAAQIIGVNQSYGINTQLGKNITSIQNNLGLIDTTLAGIVTNLQGIHEQIISAGNSTHAASDKAGLALNFQGYYDQLMSFANSTDSSGNYLFAGQKTDTAPFNSDLPVTYQGGTIQSQIQVNSSRQMPASVLGSELFSNGEIFNALQSAITALSTPSTDSGPQSSTQVSALSDLNSLYNKVFSAVSDAQSSIGARLTSLDALELTNDNMNLQLKQSLSILQDTDYNKAASDLVRQQFILQAAQKTFGQIGKSSLFDYIS